MLLSWGHFRFCGVEQSFLGKVFSSLCHINSPWDLRLHPVQSSCFAEEEPEGQRGKVAHLSVAAGARRSSSSPPTQESASLGGCSCWTPHTPTASHRGAQGTSHESLAPWPPQEWRDGRGHGPASGRTRLRAGSRTGQSGRDGVPSQSPLKNLPPDS